MAQIFHKMISDLQEFDSLFNNEYTWGQLAEYLVNEKGWINDFSKQSAIDANIGAMEIINQRNLMEDERNARA